jgi:hypothetical protein
MNGSCLNYRHAGIYSFLVLPPGGSLSSYLTRCTRYSALHPGKSGGLVIVDVGNGKIDLEKVRARLNLPLASSRASFGDHSQRSI